MDFTPAEHDILVRNAQQLEKLRYKYVKHCANPYCQIPLEPLVPHNDIHDREVCELCFETYWAVTRREFFIEAQVAYELEIGKKRRMMEGNK